MLSNRVLSMPGVQMAYGCVFCLSGKESLVAHCIEQRNAGLHATAVCQTKRRTQRGVTTLQDEIMLHGYVLFQAPENTPVNEALSTDDAIAVLTYSGGDWRLYGDDERYAEWVFHNNGLIGISQARKVGDLIHITQGPLKDLEGQIIRIDRRNRSGQVSISFGGRLITVWLGFDITEDVTADLKAVVAGPA